MVTGSGMMSTQITSDRLLEQSKSWSITTYRNWWWLQAGNGSTYSGRVKPQLSPSNLTALIMSCSPWLWCFTYIFSRTLSWFTTGVRFYTGL